MMVNFDALSRWAKYHGGFAVCTSQVSASLKVCLLCLGVENHVNMLHRMDALELCTPDALSFLCEELRWQLPNPSASTINSLLALSHCDPEVTSVAK